MRRVVGLPLVIALALGLLACQPTAEQTIEEQPTAEEVKLTPQELFAERFRSGNLVFPEDVVLIRAEKSEYGEITLTWRGGPANLPNIGTYEGRIIFKTSVEDSYLILVLEDFITTSPYWGEPFDEIRLRWNSYEFSGDGTLVVKGELFEIWKHAEGEDLFWGWPFSFEPSPALIDALFGEKAGDDPNTAALVESLKASYRRMVDYLQEGKPLEAEEEQAWITQTILENVLTSPREERVIKVSALCRLGSPCTRQLMERDEDGNLQFYRLNADDQTDVVWALQKTPDEIDVLIGGVEIIYLSQKDWNLDIRWTEYHLAVWINGVWYMLESVTA